MLSLARFIKKPISCHAVALMLETWLRLCSAFCLHPILARYQYPVFRSTYPMSSVLISMRPTVVLFLSFLVSCGISETLSCDIRHFSVIQRIFANLYPCFVRHRSELARFANTFYYFSGFRSIIKEDSFYFDHGCLFWDM